MAFSIIPPISSNAQSTSRYHIAVCDWMILKRQKLGEFELARKIEADGVEMDMGSLGKRIMFDNQLRDSVQAAKFKHYADSFNIKVASIAMSGFFAQSFITRDNYEELIKDGINTARYFNSKVIFLPLGGCGDNWQNNECYRKELIKRLRIIGGMARDNGLVIGIRTSLSAKEDISLLKEINCDNIKIYYNFQDAADAKRDICKELKMLGRDRIIQIHASNTDSVNLNEDTEIDMPRIKKTLDKLGWSGWLVIERSRDINHIRDVTFNYKNNVKYLKDTFLLH